MKASDRGRGSGAGRQHHISPRQSIFESASRPLVDFSVLNDNLIKYLTSCVKCTSRFLMKVQSIRWYIT
jgi:hypothetical protein